MLASVYRKYWKHRVFNRIILLFSFIAVMTLIVAAFLAYSFMSQSIIHRELDGQQRALESVSAYLAQKYEQANAFMQDIYRENALADDLSNFLTQDYQDYIRLGLERYQERNLPANASLHFYQSRFDRDADIANIMLYSTEKQFLYVFRQGASRLIDTHAARSFVPDAMAVEMNALSVPNIWVRNAIEQRDSRLYSVQIDINDARTYQHLGKQVVYYRSEGIDRALANFNPEIKGDVLVLNPEGEVLYDSSNRYYGQIYPYADRLASSRKLPVLEEEDAYVTTLNETRLGYTVVGLAPRGEVAEAYRGVRNNILIIALLCILFAVCVPAWFVRSFSRRLHNMIRSMRKVESGDLNVRVPAEHEDELGQISSAFNQMLEELNTYIDKEYKSELRQKRTELAALQARVNPHFLYNTLEAIRMRAVSQGADDVSDMIYSLAMLFKNLVRQHSVISLGEELENARGYLELFRIRYKDRFSYSIATDPELDRTKVMKLSLQPLIENYVVHGINSERDHNELVIRAVKEADGVRIEVTDNGVGIPANKLAEIRTMLRGPEDGASFGLRSVQDRLRLLFGEKAFVRVGSREGQGTTITLQFPQRTEGGEQRVSHLSG